MRILFLTIVTAAMLFIIAAASQDAAEDDMKKLQGTWDVVAAERDGKKAPDEENKEVKLVIAGHVIAIKQGGKEFAMAYKLDPSKKPKAIDLTHTAGPRQGEIDRGIYAIEEGILKLCLSRGKERPIDFTTQPNSDRHLLLLKKQRP